jgi:hypothetical protein
MNVRIPNTHVRPRATANCSDKGIWAPYEAFYIHAMLFNTRSAATSIECVSTALEQVSRSLSGDAFAQLGRSSMLCELQDIILQAAGLSRYFWPVRKGHEVRAEQLRAAFDVADNNPLKNRDLRNEIEHFDERLDAYISDGIAGYIFPEFVGLLPEGDGVPTHIFRAYYINTGVFEMLGKRYEIEPIAHEIIRVHDRLLLADHNGSRLGGL